MPSEAPAPKKLPSYYLASTARSKHNGPVPPPFSSPLSSRLPSRMPSPSRASLPPSAHQLPPALQPPPPAPPEGDAESAIVKSQIEIKSVKASYFGLYRYATGRDLAVIFGACLCAIASGAALPVMTILFGKLSSAFQQFATGSISYDELVGQLSSFTLDFVFIAIAQFVVSYCAILSFIYIGERLTQRIRAAYLAALLRQNVALFDKVTAGEVTTRITADMQSIQEGLSEKVSQTISATSTFVSAFIIGFANYWKLALILLSAPIAIALLIFTGFSMAAKSAELNIKEVGVAGSMALEVLASIRTVVALGVEETMARKLEKQILIAKKFGRRSRIAIDMIVGGMQGISFAAYGLIFWLGSQFIVNGEESFGSVVTLALALTMGATALGRVTPNIRTFSQCISAASKVMPVIQRQSSVDSLSDQGLIPRELIGDIKLRGIKQIYPSRPDVVVMHDFSLDIPAGKTTAIVGSSGSGKSTIVQLIQRFYSPIRGQILVDGQDIQSLNVKWLRSQMALVSQEPIIFKASIYENISYGLANSRFSNASKETVRRLVHEAAAMANADEFIQNMDRGFDTEIDVNALSGGQRQRIAIARAIIRDPAILLLDEATSMLDTTSEKLVQEAIRNASASRTTVIIAHRLSTIKHADNIVVMAHGKVVEQGTHSSLVQRGGTYATLVSAQQIGQEQEQAKPRPVSGLRPMKSVEIAALPKNKSHPTIPLGAKPSISKFTDMSSPRSVGPITPFDSMADLRGEAAKQDRRRSFRSTSRSYKLRRSAPAQWWRSALKAFQNAMSAFTKSVTSITKPQLKGKPLPKQGHGTWTLMKFVASLNKGDTILIVGVLVASTLLGLIFPTNSIFFAESIVAVAQPLPNNAQQILQQASFWSLMYLMLAIAMILIFTVQGFSHANAAERLLYRARSQTYRTFLRQDIGFFDNPKHSAGALLGILASQPNNLAGMSGITLGTVLSAVSTLLAALIVSIAVGWQLALVCASTIPVLLLCGYLRVRVLAMVERKLKTSHDDSARYACESIGAIREVAALTLEQQIIDRFRNLLQPELRTILVSAAKSSLLHAASQSLVFFCFALGFWYGGTQIALGRYTLIQFFICFATIIFGAQAAGQIFSYAPDMSKAAQAATILKGLFERKPLVKTTGAPLVSIKGDVTLENVHFTYPTRLDRPALRGLDISIKAGQFAALVGASGCGKSTTISLLERFYEPSSGRIFVDDQDISELALVEYRSFVSLVPQEPTLYRGTIRENILYGVPSGRPAVSDAHFERVCREADVWDFVSSLPDGFETMCGVRGGLLSGGQKQRVAIARALMRDPRILLLDESTSALDSNSERVVQRALEKAAKSRTTIAISHRLSAIRNADIIFVVDEGRVVERGTHGDLCRLGGKYAELVKAQDLDG